MEETGGTLSSKLSNGSVATFALKSLREGAAADVSFPKKALFVFTGCGCRL
jgi:hypothetical protein